MAMTRDETALAEMRQPDDYERRLAAEIVAMIHNIGTDPRRVLAIIAAILSLELPPSEPAP
jgi:hypothetical protein